MSEHLRGILRALVAGEISEDDAMQQVARQPFEEHLIGRFDHLREVRTGLPEVIFTPGKKLDAVMDLFATYRARGEQLIASRATDEVMVAAQTAGLVVFERAATVAVFDPKPHPARRTVLVVSAGTSDARVAEEAAVTSELLGNPTTRLYDVGVAGISRLSSELGRLDEAGIVIVVAGMDGVLPSLVNGLALQPVIAVPTSVGYGAAFEGVAALLTMLNACSPGLAVVNIDNGFGAAMLATKINRLTIDESRTQF